MKILQIISCGSITGGAENIVFQTNKVLRKKGHTVKTLSSDLFPNRESFSDYTFKSIDPRNPFKVIFYLFNFSAYFNLKKILSEYQPDIVHLHVMNQLTPSVLFPLRNYPTIMTLHGPEPFLSSQLLWFLQPSSFRDYSFEKKDLTLRGKFDLYYFSLLQRNIYKLVLKNVDVFIAPSKYMAKEAKKDLKRVRQIYNFINPLTFSKINKKHNVLYVGRLTPVKGVNYLIEAMPKVVKRFPSIQLTIVGDGDSKLSLENKIKSLNLKNNVKIIGWIESKKLKKYYEYASVIVIPSIWPENFPTVCNEAMSVGRPVIGTNVGGVPEIIDDKKNGFLVQPKNSREISDKILYLFSHENVLEEMSKNARKKAELFGIEKHVADLENIYKQVTKKYSK